MDGATAATDQALAAWAENDRQTKELLAHPNTREVKLPPAFMMRLLTIREQELAAGDVPVYTCEHVGLPVPTTTAAWALNVSVCRRCEDSLHLSEDHLQLCDVCGRRVPVAGVGRFVVGAEHVLYRLCTECVVVREGQA